MMIYVLYGILVTVAFLAVLNGFLRGVKKAQIDVVLSLLLIGMVIAVFATAGWMHGFLAIFLAFFSAVITRPIAARIASRLFKTSFSVSGDGGGYIGLPPRPLQRISEKLGRPLDPDKIDEGCDRLDNAEEELLDYCEQQPSIQVLLREFNVSRSDLQKLYNRLIMVGAGQWTCGHWVAASALAYPMSLQYLLSRREENIQETAFRLIMYFEQGSALNT